MLLLFDSDNPKDGFQSLSNSTALTWGWRA